MMNVGAGHWTSESTEAFAYRISSDFVLQLEKRMEGHISQNDLARRLNVSKGRVSQVLNNPGNLTLKNVVQYARALEMKVAIVAYDDGDAENKNGPISSEIFYQCWKSNGKPTDFFSLQDCSAVGSTLAAAPSATGTVYFGGPHSTCTLINSAASGYVAAFQGSSADIISGVINTSSGGSVGTIPLLGDNECWKTAVTQLTEVES
jgi:transcriptional regulator with XRE-family HTH domain